MDPLHLHSPAAARRRVAGACLALAAALACASGAPRAPRRPAVTVETLADGTKVICEVERPTGSHIPERVCRRATDADEQRERARATMVRPASNQPPRD